MNDEQRAVLGRLLEGQGYRELAAAYLFCAGLPLAPTPDDKLMLAEQVNDELGHFDAAAAAYSEAGLGDLLASVEQRARELPAPSSWPEMVVAQFLFDRAGYFQLKSHLDVTYPAYAQMVRKILAGEEHHQAACEARLRELHGSQPRALGAAEGYVERWLRLSIRSFERSGAMPTADLAAVLRAYLANVKTTLEAVGLRLPSRASLGLDLPPDLPLEGA